MIERLPALDGLRGVAILLVVASHAISQAIPGGFGVTLFFFISGFIITRLLLGDNRLWPFYARRIARLAPALLVFVAVTCLLSPVVPGDVAAALLYYANYHQFTMALDQTWSLAIEEHFYAVFPALLIALSVKRLQSALIAFVVAVLLWRIALVVGGDIERIHRASDTRLDSIAYGCLLSIMIHHKSKWLGVLSSRRVLAFGAALLAATFALRSPAFRESVRYSLQGLALMPLFCGLFYSNNAPAWLRATLESKALVYVGTVSYSLYLYNGFGSVLGVQNPLLGLFIVSVPATLASFYLVERPARRYLPVLWLKWLRWTSGLKARGGQT